MGRQKQQRRLAKKKKGCGGKKAAKDEVAPTLKCTACRQVVTADISVACPVPECDRIFCTRKCASSCIVRCANPQCSCPERCRPCASGTTVTLLARRYVRRGDNGHNWSELSETFVFGCAACKNRVCTRCACKCTTCKKMLCLSCAGSEGLVACSYSQCSVKYCSSACLPQSFDMAWCTCCGCIADGAIVIQENREIGVIKGKNVDEVVLDYAECVSDCFRLIICMSKLRSSNQIVAPADEAETLLDRMELVEQILGPSQQTTHEMALERIYNVAHRCFMEFHSMKEQEFERSAAGHCDAIMTALLPDITASVNSFTRLNFFLSSEDHIRSLEKLQLDTMQRFFRKKLCGHCFRRVNNASPQRCGGCKAVYYCDESCQSLSWPAHSHLCACMKRAREAFNSRVMGKPGPSVEDSESEDEEEVHTEQVNREKLDPEENEEEGGGDPGNMDGIGIGDGQRKSARLSQDHIDAVSTIVASHYLTTKYDDWSPCGTDSEYWFLSRSLFEPPHTSFTQTEFSLCWTPLDTSLFPLGTVR